MEYRDRTRIVAPEGDDDGEDFPGRPRRFELARAAGRLDLRKVAVASGIVVTLLAVIFYAGGNAVAWLVGWLHRQPQYQLPFNQIELPVPPPECFRGGAAAFLERVRKNAKEPEVLSVLDVDPERLANAFKQFPWVERVELVEFPPRSLVVRLAYRKPVLRVLVGGTVELVLDREGCILPMDDIDVGKVGRLIRFSDPLLVAPSRDRVGLVWKTEKADLDRLVIEAARLADFLLDPAREAEAKANPALRVTYILPDRPPRNRGLFIQRGTQTYILWGFGPGYEAAAEPSAEEKWDIMVKQAKTGELSQERPPGYWQFNHTGMVFLLTPKPS